MHCGHERAGGEEQLGFLGILVWVNDVSGIRTGCV